MGHAQRNAVLRPESVHVFRTGSYCSIGGIAVDFLSGKVRGGTPEVTWAHAGVSGRPLQRAGQWTLQAWRAVVTVGSSAALPVAQRSHRDGTSQEAAVFQ